MDTLALQKKKCSELMKVDTEFNEYAKKKDNYVDMYSNYTAYTAFFKETLQTGGTVPDNLEGVEVFAYKRALLEKELSDISAAIINHTSMLDKKDDKKIFETSIGTEELGFWSRIRKFFMGSPSVKSVSTEELDSSYRDAKLAAKKERMAKYRNSPINTKRLSFVRDYINERDAVRGERLKNPTAEVAPKYAYDKRKYETVSYAKLRDAFKKSGWAVDAAGNPIKDNINLDLYLSNFLRELDNSGLILAACQHANASNKEAVEIDTLTLDVTDIPIDDLCSIIAKKSDESIRNFIRPFLNFDMEAAFKEFDFRNITDERQMRKALIDSYDTVHRMNNYSQWLHLYGNDIKDKMLLSEINVARMRYQAFYDYRNLAENGGASLDKLYDDAFYHLDDRLKFGDVKIQKKLSDIKQQLDLIPLPVFDENTNALSIDPVINDLLNVNLIDVNGKARLCGAEAPDIYLSRIVEDYIYYASLVSQGKSLLQKDDTQKTLLERLGRKESVEVIEKNTAYYGKLVESLSLRLNYPDRLNLDINDTVMRIDRQNPFWFEETQNKQLTEYKKRKKKR